MKINFLGILLGTFLAGNFIAAEEGEKPEVELSENLKGQLEATITIGEFKETRVLHDSDGDGWCDLWCEIFKDKIGENRNRKTDSDGDGLTDYQEMILWRNPGVKEELPRVKTVAEKEEDAKRGEEQRKERLKEQEIRRKSLEPFMVRGNDPNEAKESKKDKRLRKLTEFKEKQIAKKQEHAQKIREYSNKMGVPASGEDSSGHAYVLEFSDGRVQKKSGDNVNSADSISTDEVLPYNAVLAANGYDGGGSTGYNLTGNGFKMGLWDEKDPLSTHSFYYGRVTDKDGYSGGTHFHSTHVLGTMISNGNGSLLGRGMSTEGNVDAYSFDDDMAEMATAVSQGLTLSNHSYSYGRGWDGTVAYAGANRFIWRGDITVSQNEDYLFGFYNEIAKETDSLVYDAQTYLPVWSAGNERGTDDEPGTGQHIGHVYFDANGNPQLSNLDRPNDSVVSGGYDVIADYAVAKNVLTVGATEDVIGGYSSSSGVGMSTFSSWGSIDDGRIKPDVSANGVSLLSSAINGGVVILSGTSMAAPSVTGSINLLREQYENLLGGNEDALSSTWKALVIHTADETGSSLGPDYKYGWGLMNTKNAAILIEDHANSGDSLTHIKEIELSSGDSIDFTVTAIGGEPIKITACWTDPEGTVPTKALNNANNPSLINDLDLRASDGVTTYYPWKLDPANPSNSATRNSDNDRDNVEQVVIDSPTSGEEFEITLTHKGSLVDDSGSVSSQNLSLIITGVEVSDSPTLRVMDLLETGTNEFTALWESVVGGIYDVETSSDLVSWTLVETDILATKDLTAFPLSTGGASKKFWRIIRTK